MRYLLDSDTCVWILRERDPVFSRIGEESPDDVAVASMTEAELRYGALRSSDPERGLARVEAFLSAPFSVLGFDRVAARRHAETRNALRSNPVGERDLIKASIALAHELVVVTCNDREFGRVPGLSTENWLEP